MSRAYVDAHPRGELAFPDVAAWGEGLIVLSGGVEGAIGRALSRGDLARAERIARTCAETFRDRFYLEVSRTRRPGEGHHVPTVVELAARLELPVVATHDVCFLTREEFEAHETRVCMD